MQESFRQAPQHEGRFAGTAGQQAELAEQMRELFDDDPGPDTVMLKHSDTLGLAGDLSKAQPRWSIGQYSSALASLLDPESL